MAPVFCHSCLHCLLMEPQNQSKYIIKWTKSKFATTKVGELAKTPFNKPPSWTRKQETKKTRNKTNKRTKKTKSGKIWKNQIFRKKNWKHQKKWKFQIFRKNLKNLKNLKISDFQKQSENSEEHQHGKIRWPSMSGHRIFPYRFLHGGRLKKSNCLPTNAVFKTNIPLEGNVSFCRGMIWHEGGRGNSNTTQILNMTLNP